MLFRYQTLYLLLKDFNDQFNDYSFACFQVDDLLVDIEYRCRTYKNCFYQHNILINAQKRFYSNCIVRKIIYPYCKILQDNRENIYLYNIYIIHF